MSKSLPMTYEAAGIASMLIGMRHSRELLDLRIQELEQRLVALQTGELPAVVPAGRRPRGRPPKARTASPTVHGAPLVNGWSTDPEERRREMARRAAKHAQKKAVVETDDKKEAFRKKMRKAAKNVWANLTPAQRTARLLAMQAGRSVAPKPNGVAA
jgi:hypothetical protein